MAEHFCYSKIGLCEGGNLLRFSRLLSLVISFQSTERIQIGLSRRESLTAVVKSLETATEFRLVSFVFSIL